MVGSHVHQSLWSWFQVELLEVSAHQVSSMLHVSKALKNQFRNSQVYHPAFLFFFEGGWTERYQASVTARYQASLGLFQIDTKENYLGACQHNGIRS